MPSRRISTSKLLALVMSLSSVLSYSTSPNSNRRDAKPFGIQDVPFIKVKDDNIINRPKYDLGLGKNKPLYGRKTHFAKDPVQFMIQHEAVVDYPSPLTAALQQQQNAVTSSASDSSKKEEQHLQLQQQQQQQQQQNLPVKPKQQRVLPKVKLERKSEDVLNISHHENRLPHMTTITNPRQNVKMDLNTAWVEMLIYSEKTKIATAS